MATQPKKAKSSSEISEVKLATKLEMIDVCQNEIDDLNEKASEEVLKVEQKYNVLRRPLFQKRNELTKQLNGFWHRAIMNHPYISCIVENDDEERILEYMDYLDVQESPELRGGYKLLFHFRENPYFHNKCLTKEYVLGNESQVSESTSTPIEWKDGKNPSKRQHAKDGETGRRRRHVDFKSFFDWFQDNSDPANDEIAELIKDDLWPNPLQYYLIPDIEVGDEEEDDEEDDGEEGEGVDEEPEGDQDSDH